MPPTVTALEEQTQVLPGDTTPAGRCTLNETEQTKDSAETDRNKEQGKTGAVPPWCTLRSSLSLVASLLRKRILHKRLASALPRSKHCSFSRLCSYTGASIDELDKGFTTHSDSSHKLFLNSSTSSPSRFLLWAQLRVLQSITEKPP